MIFPPVLADYRSLQAALALQQKTCFEAGGFTHTQSSAEVIKGTGWRKPSPASSAANGCLVA